jgi:DNA sulfur modification protein DndD
MKLHKLTIYNFMPYKGRQVVEFPREDTRNVMIVFGDNMRGKTSLLNAIRWGFYGRALGRHSRPIELQELVNKDATLEDDWRMEVFVEFDANGHRYDLRRSANRRSHVATPSRPEDFHVPVHLTRDGIQISGDQIEAEIDQFAPEQISRFFLFDGELLEEYESLLIEGSEQGRKIKDAIEQVLGVPSLINGRTEVGAILKSATKRQSSELSHIQGLEKAAARQQELTARQDAYDRDLKDLQERLSKVRSEKLKLDDDLLAADSVLAAKAKLDSLLILKKTCEDTRDRKKVERHGVLASAWQDLLDARLGVKRSQLERRQLSLTQGLKQQGRLQSRIEDLQRLLTSNECPTCGQDIANERRSHIGSTLGTLQTEATQISDETADLQTVSAQLASINKIRGINARDRLREIDKDAKAAEVELQRAENEIERLNDEIAGEDTAELSRKRVLQGEALKEDGRLSQSISNVRRDIEKIKEDLAVAQKAIEGLAPERSKRSTLKVSIATDLERIFAASIEELRDRLRTQVGKLADSAFKRMTTQKSYQGLEINSNYGLSILDSAARKVPLRSAGAEQVVALSLIDGLNRTGRGVGPVVMDTPFGRLDIKHRDNILSYLPTVTSQFILLVHSGEIRPETDLTSVRSRIGAVYRISEVNATQSIIERATI